MSEKRWPNCETADDWVAELDRRMDADPNVELAPVAVGIMRTTQIIHEAMQAAEERGRRAGIASAQLAVDAVVAVCNSQQDLQYRNGALMAAEAIRALAPRDSGKEKP